MLIVQNILPDGTPENRWTAHTGFSMFMWKTHSLKLNKTPKLMDDVVKRAEELTPFSSKQEYLEWVKQWKFEHASLVKRQKELKIILAQPHGMEESLRWDGPTFKNIPCTITNRVIRAMQSEKVSHKQQLEALYNLRRHAKNKSWNQKQAAKLIAA